MIPTSRAAREYRRLRQINCQTLVIGAGIAGMSAALSAIEKSKGTVVVIDKSSNELGGGNTSMTSGGFLYHEFGPESPAQRFQKVMVNGLASPPLAKIWSENYLKSLDRLKQWGINVVKGEDHMFIEPGSKVSAGPVYLVDVGKRILTKLKERFLSGGGKYLSRTKALKLIMGEPNVIEGTVAQIEDRYLEIHSKSTIISTGGFQANEELVTKYIGAHAGECKVRSSSECTGDGLKMALEVGAKAVNLSYFYGHLLCLESIQDDKFWPYPRLDDLLSDGILVDQHGNRFVDEGRGDIAVSNEVARRTDVRRISLVFDERAWRDAKKSKHFGRSGAPSPNPWITQNGGHVFRARSIVSLCRDLGVNKNNLEKTISLYNRMVKSKKWLQNPVPPRSGRPKPLLGPYCASKVVPGITFTMGGILIDAKGRVQSLEGGPISGLYAAGDAIGGLMGGYDGGYVGGLSQAIITGILAGENAVASFKK